MSWLLPQVILPTGKPRTVGEPDKRERAVTRQRRWMRSAQGRAYYATRRKDPEYRRRQQERHKRWLESPRGQGWVKANREKRNYYYRMRYAANPDRRAYLNEKQRQYRAAKKAKCSHTQ